MEKVIIAGLALKADLQSQMDELQALVEAAGAQVIYQTVQNKDKIDASYYFGKGKVEELAFLVEDLGADALVVNHELSGSQLRNLEELIACKIVDRTNLILDIFALRATSLEGKLQVALAQLEYRLPRIIGFSDYLSKTGGGIGTRGPGEQKLETDRRHIQREITQIKRQLKQMQAQRRTKRKQRLENRIPIVSLVGYTNAGKSTLMNQLKLDDQELFVKDMLFATLDTSLRQARLPSGQKILLADTVGFVSHLPTSLVEAFKGTLEEIKYSDLILHVVDASHQDLDLQMETTQEILQDLGVQDKKILHVFNKMDLVDQDFIAPYPDSLYISALNEDDLQNLQRQIEKMIQADYELLELSIPYQEHHIYHELREKFGIISEKRGENATKLVVSMSQEAADRYQKYRLM